MPSTQVALQFPALSGLGLKTNLLATLVRDAIQQLVICWWRSRVPRG